MINNNSEYPELDVFNPHEVYKGYKYELNIAKSKNKKVDDKKIMETIIKNLSQTPSYYSYIQEYKMEYPKKKRITKAGLSKYINSKSEQMKSVKLKEHIKKLTKQILKEEFDYDMDEMARVSKKIQLGDNTEALEALKAKYADHWMGKVINAVEKSKEGITKQDMVNIAGKSSQQQINGPVNSLIDKGVFKVGDYAAPLKGKPVSDRAGIKGRPKTIAGDIKDFLTDPESRNQELLDKIIAGLTGMLSSGEGEEAETSDDAE